MTHRSTGLPVRARPLFLIGCSEAAPRFWPMFVRNMFFCVFTSCRFCLASPLADNNQIGSSLACIWLAHIAWRTSTSVILASNLFKYINSIFRISSQNMAMTVWYYFDVHIRSPRDYTKWISKESAPRWINKERSGGN